MLRAEIRNLDFKPTPRLLGFNHQADFQFLTVLYQYRLVPRKSFKSGDLKWSFRKITTLLKIYCHIEQRQTFRVKIDHPIAGSILVPNTIMIELYIIFYICGRENFAMLYILFDIEIMFNIREYHKGMYGQYRLSF